MFCGFLRQSTAATIMLGPIVDDDGITVATGLTISQADVRLSKNAGNMAQKNESTSCTHDELGVYTCPLDTTDTNTLGILDVVAQESGNLVARQSYMVISAGEWDRLMAATGPVPNQGILARGTAQSATGTTLQMASGEAFDDDTLNGCFAMAYGSTQGYWQVRQITDTVLSTDTLTVDAWTVTPSGTITYVIVAGVAGLSDAAVADAVWDEALSGHSAAGSTGEALDTASSAAGLDAAGVRAAVGLASANLDTQLGGLDTDVAAVASAVASLDDAAAVVAALLASTIDGVTVADYLSAAGGANFSISGTTLTVKDVAGNTIYTRDLTLVDRNAINVAAVP